MPGDYLHIFAKGQADLNWESAEARKEIHESALRFWLKKGIDGFRVDTCDIYSKDPELRDTIVNSRTAPFGDPQTGMENGPKIHEYWQDIRKQVLDDFGDPLMVGEMSLSSFEDTLKYIGQEPRELSMVFDFTYTKLGMENSSHTDLVLKGCRWAAESAYAPFPLLQALRSKGCHEEATRLCCPSHSLGIHFQGEP